MNFHISSFNIFMYLAFILAVASGLACMFRRYRALPFSTVSQKKHLNKEEKKWRYILGGVMLICGCFLVFLLSNSWTQGDDWRNIFCRGNAYTARIPDTLSYYFTFVSRVGDIFIWMFGQSFGRMETHIATALTTALLPLAFFRLCTGGATSLYSPKGIAFYIFAFFLCLMGVCHDPWRNYFCWAAVINYLIPTLATVYFLSFYRSDRLTSSDTKARCIALFSLGVFCGWGTECGDVVLIPFLIIYALYCRHKKMQWPTSCSFGMLGTWLGAGLLFASPALQCRANAAREAMAYKVADMAPEQIQAFLANLDWESANMLEGAGGIIFIGDFSFTNKLHFLPLLLERFWACCNITVVCIGVLFTLILLLNSKGNRLTPISTAMAGMLVSGIMACSYLASCIPCMMSFLPPCFILVGTCCYLFLRLEKRCLFSWFPTILLSIFSLSLLLPAGIEAMAYKKYELAQYAEIKRQHAIGNTDIVLPYPYEQEPRNRLGLINAKRISQEPQKNGFILEVFRQNIAKDIRSIRQLPKTTGK